MYIQLVYILAALCCSINANTHGSSYITLDSYRATEDDYLSFKIGEIISLKSVNIEADPSVWLGDLHGQTGKFNRTHVRRNTYEVIVNRTVLNSEDNQDNIYLDLVLGDIVEVIATDGVIEGYWLGQHGGFRGFIKPFAIIPSVYESQYNYSIISSDFLNTTVGDLLSVIDKSSAYKGYVIAENNGVQGQVFTSAIHKPIYGSLYHFNTTHKEDLSFNTTDLMVLFSKTVGGEEREGWWWASNIRKNSTSDSGFVPRVHMTKASCTVLLPYPSSSPLELNLSIDDNVELISKVNGSYYLGVSKTSYGYFPSYCCSFDV